MTLLSVSSSRLTWGAQLLVWRITQRSKDFGLCKAMSFESLSQVGRCGLTVYWKGIRHTENTLMTGWHHQFLPALCPCHCLRICMSIFSPCETGSQGFSELQDSPPWPCDPHLKYGVNLVFKMQVRGNWASNHSWWEKQMVLTSYVDKPRSGTDWQVKPTCLLHLSTLTNQNYFLCLASILTCYTSDQHWCPGAPWNHSGPGSSPNTGTYIPSRKCPQFS